MNQVFSFDSPHISNDPFMDTFDIGIVKSMVPTDTVIIQDYSNLFSFHKLFAINSKISPSIEACLLNAKLSKVQGLLKSRQRAWKISHVIYCHERRKNTQCKSERQESTLIDPVRMLATHLVNRFFRAQDFLMVSTIVGRVLLCSTNFRKVLPKPSKDVDIRICRSSVFSSS